MRRFQARGSASHTPSPVGLVSLLLLSGYTCCQVFFAIQPKKSDMPVGEFRWLTVVSPDDIELLLEPNDNPAARTYQEALFQAGIPSTIFAVEDIQKEYEIMTKLGVVFRTKPRKTEGGTDAVFEDTCGNLISLHQD